MDIGWRTKDLKPTTLGKWKRRSPPPPPPPPPPTFISLHAESRDMQTSCLSTYEHNSSTCTPTHIAIGWGHYKPRYRANKILDLQSWYQASDRAASCPVLSLVLSCLSLSSGVGWFISDDHVLQYLFLSHQVFGNIHACSRRHSDKLGSARERRRAFTNMDEIPSHMLGTNTNIRTVIPIFS